MDLARWLVADGLVPHEAMARALRLQRTAGGAIDTALLELDAVDEESLALALARAAGLPPAPPAVLAEHHPQLRKVLPGPLAEQHRLAPFRLEGRDLVVLAAWPIDLAALDELGGMRGVRIVAHAAPELWVKELQHRVYGTPVPTRLAKLARTLAARAESALDVYVESGAQRVPPPPVAAAPPPAPRPPVAAAPPPAPAPRGAVAAASAPAPAVVAAPRAPEPPASVAPDALEALATAGTHEEVVRAALTVAAARFELAAFLAVGKGRIFCVDAAGADAAAVERARGFASPLPAPGVVGAVLDGAPHVGALGADEPLLAALARGDIAGAVLQPVRVAGRVAGVLYGDVKRGQVDGARARGLVVLAAATGAALERIVRARKGAAPAR